MSGSVGQEPLFARSSWHTSRFTVTVDGDSHDWLVFVIGDGGSPTLAFHMDRDSVVALQARLQEWALRTADTGGGVTDDVS